MGLILRSGPLLCLAVSAPEGLHRRLARRAGGKLVQVEPLHGRVEIATHHTQAAHVFVDFDENQQVEFLESHLVTWPNRLGHELDDRVSRKDGVVPQVGANRKLIPNEQLGITR